MAGIQIRRLCWAQATKLATGCGSPGLESESKFTLPIVSWLNRPLVELYGELESYKIDGAPLTWLFFERALSGSLEFRFLRNFDVLKFSATRRPCLLVVLFAFLFALHEIAAFKFYLSIWMAMARALW